MDEAKRAIYESRDWTEEMSDIPGFDQDNDHRVRAEIIEEIKLPVPIWENVQRELHGAIFRAGQLEGQLSATQDERDRLLKRELQNLKKQCNSKPRNSRVN